MPVTVAIIGAGPLGRWLALSAARAGFPVLLEDVMPANLHHAQEFLRQQLGPQQPAEKSRSVSGHGFAACGTMQKLEQEASGHDFSRAEIALKESRALAPAGALETEGRVAQVPRILGPGNDEAVNPSPHTVIPYSQEMEQEASGHDFSRATNNAKSSRALAPEGCSSEELPVAFVSTIEEAVRNADLVIDCVPDELESKLEILWLLDRMAPPRTVLATPTMRLSIADLANCTYRPTKCIAIAAEASTLTGKTEAAGTSPEILLRTIPQTAPETVALLDHFWRQLGFTPIFAPDPASQPSN